MSLLMELNVLAVIGPRVVHHAATPVEGANPTMIFGFFATFCTLVVLMYEHKMRTRFPLLLVCLAALSVDAFLEGTWSLGFSLAALSVSQLSHGPIGKPKRHKGQASPSEGGVRLYESESRVARMFGSP